MSAAFRFPRFFMTNAGPCPYLAGKTERKVFTELSGEHASELNDALGRIGFRRSQNVAYRPSCADCSACVSVRIVAERVQAQRHAAPAHQAQQRSRGQRLQALVDPAEQFALLQRYPAARHPTAAWPRWTRSILPTWSSRSPVDTYVIEYREPASAAARASWSAPA